MAISISGKMANLKANGSVRKKYQRLWRKRLGCNLGEEMRNV